LISDSDEVQNFMNKYFNILNLYGTELFVTLKDVKVNESAYDLDRVEELFHLVIWLIELMNIITSAAPEIFLNNDKLYGDRILNFVLSS